MFGSNGMPMVAIGLLERTFRIDRPLVVIKEIEIDSLDAAHYTNRHVGNIGIVHAADDEKGQRLLVHGLRYLDNNGHILDDSLNVVVVYHTSRRPILETATEENG